MERKRLITLLVIVFVVVLGIGLAYREFINEAIIRPAVTFVWFIASIASGVAFEVFWTVLALIATLILFLSLRSPRQPQVFDPFRESRRNDNWRVSYWSRILFQTENRIYTTYSAHRFRKLISAVLAYLEDADPNQVEGDLNAERRVLPQDTATLLDIFQHPEQRLPQGRLNRLEDRLRDWLGLRPRRLEFRQELDQTILYLEELLEIKDDPASR
jgi:hypothetical protein